MSARSPKISQESVKIVRGLGTSSLQWERQVGIDHGVKEEIWTVEVKMMMIMNWHE